MSQGPRRVTPPLPAHPAGEQYRIAIVGSGTLKGKELAEVLSQSALAASEIKLLDDDEGLGQLEAVGEEMTFVQSVSRDNFDNVDFAFFASRQEFTRKHWTLARAAGASIVDLSYALEKEPGATVRAPWIEREVGQVMAPELEPGPVVAAHPAAVVLSLLLIRAQRLAPIRNAIATVLEPASESGRSGMDELHEQTVNLLSFQEMPRKVFDAQLAFNLLGQLGEKSTAAALEETERRIVEHYRRVTGEAVPLMPAVMLAQAPNFHGYIFSIYVELETPQSVADFSQALSGEHVAVSRLPEETPNNVSVAGQEQVLVSVRQDVQRLNGFWIWAAADNLRVQALTAIECAQRLSAARPKGKVQ
jgi:aspartate-semialdehyde dehydrogenase